MLASWLNSTVVLVAVARLLNVAASSPAPLTAGAATGMGVAIGEFTGVPGAGAGVAMGAAIGLPVGLSTVPVGAGAGTGEAVGALGAGAKSPDES